MKKILHLDLDAFFASVEQLDFPKLRGKPVIVGGRGNRGVVSTCSYEARAFGVRSAMPTAIARKLCPDGIFLPVRYERYVEKSREVRRIYTQYSKIFETVGLDEAYLDVSHYPDAIPVAREMKKRVLAETGLTCSIGLSYNKSMAKIASDLKKPNAFVIIRPEQALRILKDLPIGSLHGIGKKSQERLKMTGIHTVSDFWRLPLEKVVQMFGKFGYDLYYRARGKDDREIVTDRSPKSHSRETTLPENLHERESVAEIARELLEKVRRKLADDEIPQTLTLKIKYADFTVHSKQRTVRGPSPDWSKILEELLDAFDYTAGVRLVGVGFSNFVQSLEPEYEQLSLPLGDEYL
ncbi:DNA polymerase IV [Thermoactinomyces mirandus]|uniref:DNA polymerase IV n=1 Tax=Thermoactinomyces mirandus TaxID=2756294 RepID=A0A7W1XPX7_9BACL|nr:DNA polymerase IV [Thermoactinomyces mirandus]MBA4601007.1 DNA polymerase IV [Thermoactinomyces mirandus]